MLAKSAEACCGEMVVVWTKWVGRAVAVTVTVTVAGPAPVAAVGLLGVPDPELGLGWSPPAEPPLDDEFVEPVGPPVAPTALNREFAVRSLVHVTVWNDVSFLRGDGRYVRVRTVPPEFNEGSAKHF